MTEPSVLPTCGGEIQDGKHIRLWLGSEPSPSHLWSGTIPTERRQKTRLRGAEPMNIEVFCLNTMDNYIYIYIYRNIPLNQRWMIMLHIVIYNLSNYRLNFGEWKTTVSKFETKSEQGNYHFFMCYEFCI